MAIQLTSAYGTNGNSYINSALAGMQLREALDKINNQENTYTKESGAPSVNGNVAPVQPMRPTLSSVLNGTSVG